MCVSVCTCVCAHMDARIYILLSTSALFHTYTPTDLSFPQAHIIAAQNARAVEESLKALGASGDSGKGPTYLPA